MSETPLLDAAGFKAMLDPAPTVEDQGSKLIVHGIAAEFSVDRDDEAFEPTAFDRGMKAFMANPVLAYHHARKAAADGTPPQYLALGKVTNLWRDAKGLHMDAEIPKPPDGSWASDVYEKVRAGIIKGLSVGGRFRRRWTPNGPRIFDVDMQEISITPLPVNPLSLVTAVTEGKAMNGEALEWKSMADDEAAVSVCQVAQTASQLEQLEGIATGLERLVAQRRV